MVCLFSAGIHANNGNDILFLGAIAFCSAWALWPLRSRRSGFVVWVGALAGGGAWLFRPERHRPDGAGRSKLQCAVVGALFQRRKRPDANPTAIGQIGKLKLSAADRHPACTEKRQSAAGISARGQLPHFISSDKAGMPALAAKRIRGHVRLKPIRRRGFAARQNQRGLVSTSPVTSTAIRKR